MESNFKFALYSDSLYAEVAIVSGIYYSVSDPAWKVSADQVKQTLIMCGQAYLDSKGVDTSDYDLNFDITDVAKMSTEQISLLIAGSAVKSLDIKVYYIEENWAATTLLFDVDYEEYEATTNLLFNRYRLLDQATPSSVINEINQLPVPDHKQNTQSSSSSDGSLNLMPEQPSVAQIRQFIEKSISHEDLNNLCRDEFPNVYKQFANGQTNGQRIRLLIEYVDRQREIPKLLKAIEKIQHFHC